jgi:hypothetical protein
VPLDDFIPNYDFVERHKTLVRASPDATRRAIDEWPLSSDSIMRFLFRLRGLGRSGGQSMSLRDLLKANGFLVLADNDRELIAGQIGRFWAINERGALVSPKTVDEFRAFNDPRYAVGVMDIRVEPVKRGIRLTTETPSALPWPGLPPPLPVLLVLHPPLQRPDTSPHPRRHQSPRRS